MLNPVYYLILFSFFVISNAATIADAKESQHIYIVYLGDKPHDDHVLIAKSHHDMLADVLGSESDEIKKLIVYNYKHSFSGFAAKLTEAQAKKLAETPGVLQVIRDGRHKLHNTRSWNSLGLSHDGIPGNLLHQTNTGDGMIVGVIDSGIAPDSKAFNDEGLGPIPDRWKGECKSAGLFDASKHCNKKIIGARWYIKGYFHQTRVQIDQFNETIEKTPSPIDSGGHGTHIASTAAGSFVSNVSYYGLNMGTFRGGAPRARLAIYKACWNEPEFHCASSDILAAIDDAVQDGVDVISVSLGRSFPQLPEVSNVSAMAIGTFHAVARGIPVVSAAGNDGPLTFSAQEVAPWLISVAASTVDRAFPTPIRLKNNKTIMGRSLYLGKNISFTEMVHKILPLRSSGGSGGTYIAGVRGKVILSFIKDNVEYPAAAGEVSSSGAVAWIVARPIDDLSLFAYSESMQDPLVKVPVIEVNFEAGTDLLEYIESSSIAKVMIGHSNVLVGRPLTPKIAGFSSRGPNSLAPEILKPDIAAPGSSILGVVGPWYHPNDNGFGFMSGTSMAAPHVSGIVALLRSRHPHWSPAAIRSALVTTAWNEDSSRIPIMAEGSPANLANPFDYGGGIVNPNSAAQPGLVYDMNKEDYLNYLCSQDYLTAKIYNAIRRTSTNNATTEQSICENRKVSLLDLNLPSFTIPHLKGSATLKRRVTNVGPVDSVYRAKIKSPTGVKVSVKPKKLKFDSDTTVLEFVVTVDAEEKVNTGYVFGSLTWSDGKHFVRSPISVRTIIYPLY